MSDDSNATQHYDNQEDVILQIDSERSAADAGDSTPARSARDLSLIHI